jgi:hypothetical protein
METKVSKTQFPDGIFVMFGSPESVANDRIKPLLVASKVVPAPITASRLTWKYPETEEETDRLK